MTLATERGLDPAAAAALDALEAELGPEAVHRSGDLLAEFVDPYRAAGDAGIAPAGVVQPTSTDEVRAVVRIANRFGVPIWTSSQGRNFGYGGAEARVEGSIALSLRRMNRVLHVDAEQGYAVVEPGVTFFDLYESLRGTGLWLSCPDLGRGSVLGNALDHGVGYTPYGDHTDRLCGLEVVLPDGELLRTGTGGIDGSPNWHVHKRGFGPSLDGLFAQSNLGIVTRAGIWLMPEPECYTAGMLVVPREEDLAPLVDILRPLMLDGTIGGYPLISHGFGPLVMAVPKQAWPPLTGSGSPQELAPVHRAMGVGMWMMRFALYGPSEIVALRQARVERAFAAIDSARLTFRGHTAPFTAETVGIMDQVPAGIPNMDVLNGLTPWGGEGAAGHLDFSPVSPFTGRDAEQVYRTLWRSFDRHDVKSVYTLIARERSLVHVNMMMFEKADTDAVRRAEAAARELVGAMHEHGYGEYRSHPDLADAVAGTYDFNDHVLHRTLTVLKDALDPRGVLSPGAKGIWPGNREDR